jgi:hypothetical protein
MGDSPKAGANPRPKGGQQATIRLRGTLFLPRHHSPCPLTDVTTGILAVFYAGLPGWGVLGLPIGGLRLDA